MMAQAAGGPGALQVLEWSGWVATIVMAVVAYLAYRRPRERVKIEPPLPKVEVEGELRTQAKSRRFSSEEWDAKHSALVERIQTLDAYTKTEVDRLHDKIDLVERRTGDNLRIAIDAIKETIRKLPNEIVELLKHTGQLKEHHD